VLAPWSLVTLAFVFAKLEVSRQFVHSYTGCGGQFYDNGRSGPLEGTGFPPTAAVRSTAETASPPIRPRRRDLLERDLGEAPEFARMQAFPVLCLELF
jgi:hypothetical protein